MLHPSTPNSGSPSKPVISFGGGVLIPGIPYPWKRLRRFYSVAKFSRNVYELLPGEIICGYNEKDTVSASVRPG